MSYDNTRGDKRIILTLDAGGTNFVFSAWQGGEEIVPAVTLPSNSRDLESCLRTLIDGFKTVAQRIPHKPSAISFAFPGPADYRSGIIGDLPNFESFRGGVALGPMLEEIFNIPTFINNDGDLFTYGEALAGFLPEMNRMLREAGSSRQYNNLFGVTLGTGFGGGLVIRNDIYQGDNSASGEIWLVRSFLKPAMVAESGVSIRSIKQVYRDISGDDRPLDPKEIYEIAMGLEKGEREAALKSFECLSLEVAESLAQVITLLDCPVVLGGGVSGAAKLILPQIVTHLNGSIHYTEDRIVPRLVSTVFNLDDPASWKCFSDDQSREIEVPFTSKKVTYSAEKRTAIGLSRLGTSRAIAIGAYAFALKKLGP